MKHLSKQCHSSKQVNQYLKSIGLDDLCGFFQDVNGNFLPDFNSSSADFDNWIDGTETRGVSVTVYDDFEVLVVKYTDKDIARLEAELLE